MNFGLRKNNGKILFSNLTVGICLILTFQFNIYAQEADLHSTVKVNLCGDNVAEGPEHCDGTDIPNQDCTDWGYDEGIVICDLSCHYDFSNCISYPEEETTDLSIPTPIEQYVILPPQQDDVRVSFLKSFDTNNNGLIESDEIPDIVVEWVNAWTYEFDEDFERSPEILDICDLNKDHSCDVKDFSVLMYLINNEELDNY